MNPEDREYVKKLLQKALPPSAGEPDLWPRMLVRWERQPRRVAWFDWALAGAMCCGLACFPQVLLRLLYHL